MVSAAVSDDAFAASQSVVQRLILNASGFVFDPVCGRSFTANKTGLRLLALLPQVADLAQLQEKLLQEFEVPPYVLERDVLEFIEQIRRHIK